MKKLLLPLGLGLGLAYACVVTTAGCSQKAPTLFEPNETLIYTTNLVEGGPGLVDVYEPSSQTLTIPTTTATSSTPPTTTTSSAVPKPAIIAIHGGAWRSGDKFQVAPVAFELAQRGYKVFAPNYSLAPRAKWPGALTDLQTLTRYLRSNASTLGIDPNRIGAWGMSAGGHLATMLALRDDPTIVQTTSGSGSGSGTTITTTPGGGVVTTTSSVPPIAAAAFAQGRVVCAVAAFGPADLSIPDGMAPDEDGILRDFLGAPRFQLSPLQLLNASTITYARPDTSVLILHGTADSFVAIDHSEHLYTALTSKNADVNFIRVYGGFHDSSTFHSPEAWASTLQFFDNRLKF